jgi:hypothetical protein
MKKLLCLIALSMLTFQRCSLPEVKKANFERDQQEVIADVKNLHDFEEVNLKFSTTSFDGHTTHMLIVELLNGNFPNGDDNLKRIGKDVLKIVLNSISNESDYSKFKVVFVNKGSAGIVTTSVTRPYEYELKDIK